MLKLNSELRAQAREALRGKWPMAAVAALIYSAIAGGLSAIPVIGGLCSLRSEEHTSELQSRE